MKLQTKSTRSRLFWVGAAVLTYLFLLLLSRGFVTSGDDWYFSARDTGEGFWKALEAGYYSAAGHYVSVNGRLLGNAFSRFFGTNDMVRELCRCAIILVILLQLCKTAKIKNLPLYLMALMLTVALPSDIYAQSYAWAAGFFNYVPPLMMILAYILRAERVLRGEKDTVLWGLAMLPLALSCQLFVENVTVGVCMLSAGVLVWHLIRTRKLSWSLTGFFLGAAIGCAIMFSAPGYANINNEGYRQVSATFEELMKVLKSNFAFITMYLTERNWSVIAPLTVLSICLLMTAKPEKGSGRFLRTFALTGLMVCPVWFYANRQLLKTLSYSEWVTELSFWLDIAFNLLYLLAVLTAALLGLRDKARVRLAVLCVAAVPMIFGPLVMVNPIGPRCMYIPYMLLVGILLIFAADLAERFDAAALRKLTVPVAALTCCVLAVYLWTAVWNGHCEQVRLTQIEKAMAQGASTVELPSYPYTAYVHNGNGGAIRYYYYYETPCDLEFQYINHQDWYLSK